MKLGNTSLSRSIRSILSCGAPPLNLICSFFFIRIRSYGTSTLAGGRGGEQRFVFGDAEAAEEAGNEAGDVVRTAGCDRAEGLAATGSHTVGEVSNETGCAATDEVVVETGVTDCNAGKSLATVEGAWGVGLRGQAGTSETSDELRCWYRACFLSGCQG